MGLAGARGRRGVEMAHVVAGLVRAQLRELGAAPDARPTASRRAAPRATSRTTSRSIASTSPSTIGPGPWRRGGRARASRLGLRRGVVAGGVRRRGHATRDIRLRWSSRGSGTATSTCSTTSSAVSAVAERVVGQHEPVAQDVGGEVAHVVGGHVAAAAQQRQHPSRLGQADRPARAGAELDLTFEVVRGRSGPGCGWRRRAQPSRRSRRGRPAPCAARLGVALEVGERQPLVDRRPDRRGCGRRPRPPRRPSGSRRGSSSGSGRPAPRAAGRCPRTRSGSAWPSPGTAAAPGSVVPPIVTWCSCITSSSADWTFAGARLISSASRKFANTGPSSVSNWPLSGR